MLPKNKLGRKLNSKLFVYADDQHPHVAQKPEIVELQKLEEINNIYGTDKYILRNR